MATATATATVTVSLRRDRFDRGLDNARRERGRYDGNRRMWTIPLNARTVQMARRAGEFGWVVVEATVDLEEYARMVLPKEPVCERCGRRYYEDETHCDHCGAGRDGAPDRVEVRVIDWATAQQVAGSARHESWLDRWTEEYGFLPGVVVDAQLPALIREEIRQRNTGWSHGYSTRVMQPIRDWRLDFDLGKLYIERVCMLHD